MIISKFIKKIDMNTLEDYLRENGFSLIKREENEEPDGYISYTPTNYSIEIGIYNDLNSVTILKLVDTYKYTKSLLKTAKEDFTDAVSDKQKIAAIAKHLGW